MHNDTPQPIEVEAMEWLLERGRTTSNEFLNGLFKQVQVWADGDLEHDDPLSPKQMASLVKTYQQWLTAKKVKAKVRSKFYG